MKKAFTLLEVVISITIFMILLIFLYKTLDQTKHSNKQFINHTQNLKYQNELNDIFLEDILESISKIEIKIDNDANSIVRFISSNNYHNSFFNNITYMISSNNKLLRIESKDKFNFGETQLEFFDYAFIDVLLEDVEYFKVKENTTTTNKNYAFIIKQKDKERIIFNTYKFNNVKEE
jgi:type II secretory pathway component PulJ